MTTGWEESWEGRVDAFLDSPVIGALYERVELAWGAGYDGEVCDYEHTPADLAWLRTLTGQDGSEVWSDDDWAALWEAWRMTTEGDHRRNSICCVDPDCGCLRAD